MLPPKTLFATPPGPRTPIPPPPPPTLGLGKLKAGSRIARAPLIGPRRCRAEVLQRRTDAVHRLALVVARVVGVQLVDDQAGANSVRMFPHPAPLDQNLALLRLDRGLILEPVHPWQWVAAEVALQPNVVARLAADVLELDLSNFIIYGGGGGGAKSVGPSSPSSS
ncbi:hypothetical protein TYRP_011888 [Tyrophagus putrescentiae]|nr:hypothetical protein TYRP_011888 [Tyrophagus putrescentiae]